MMRYPSWVADNALKIFVNGKEISYQANPSSYLTIHRDWKKGDVVEIDFPVKNKPLHFTVKDVKIVNPTNIELRPFLPNS